MLREGNSLRFAKALCGWWMYQITLEQAADWWEVEAIFDTAFGPGRTGLSSYRLRDGVLPVDNLCFVARDEMGILAGCIRFWPIRIGGHEGLLLGPIAVHPTRQGEGLGGMLMAHALDRARELGWARVLLVGDASYYARFGFNKVDGVEMPPPTNPDRVLGQSLVPGGFDDVTGLVQPWKLK